MALLGTKSLLKSNIELWLTDIFLRQGLYTNVDVGDTTFYGQNTSLLNPVTSDPNYADGRVFQSAFKNWVYETDIPSPASGVAPPTVASGVTVDGTFYPEATTSGTYEHFVDFPNGRIIFASALAGSPVVEAAFAYKTVHIDSASSLDNENTEALYETAYKDNPPQTGIPIYPQERNFTLPAVFYDFQRRRSLPYELGTRDPIKQYFGVFHIWARDEMFGDIIEDVLADEQRQVILGINFNDAPFPLLSRGRRNPAWPGYSAQANLYGPFFWRKIYLDSTEPRQMPALFEVERIGVDFEIKVYPNF